MSPTQGIFSPHGTVHFRKMAPLFQLAQGQNKMMENVNLSIRSCKPYQILQEVLINFLVNSSW